MSWKLIIIKQNKMIVKISGKRYNRHNAERETFTLFRDLIEPFNQSVPSNWIKSPVQMSIRINGFNRQWLKKAGGNQQKCYMTINHQRNIDRKVSKPLKLVLCLIWVCNICKSFIQNYICKNMIKNMSMFFYMLNKLN